jgi:dipeptidyl aminopeptidase/acylaminoacyl peptidase
MRIKLIFFLLVAFYSIQISGQHILTHSRVKINTPYSNLNEFYKWYYDSTYYEQARNSKSFECLKLIYQSDTAKVEAWLYKPIQISGKYPVIIYNRGGNGNFGNLIETNIIDFHKFAEAGFIVLATKTRFAGSNGKWDQHGGIDVDDITNLTSLFNSFSFIDTNNVFMYGFSRGGQNTYQASLKLNLNAIAVTAGTTDWITRINDRKEFVEGWIDEDSSLNFVGFRKSIPNWSKDSIQELVNRSALYWVNLIKTPVLLLHSSKDPKVPCMQTILMAEQLQKFEKEYEMVIYNEPSHSLPFSQFDSFDRIINWFNRHKKT